MTHPPANATIPSASNEIDPIDRFRAGFVPSLLMAGALTTVAATAIAFVVTRLITGSWWVGANASGPILCALTLAAALSPFLTARALHTQSGVPKLYWVQATFQLLWLLYLAWSTHMALSLVAVLLLLAAVVNDTRYLYDSVRLRVHYGLAAPFFVVFLLGLDLTMEAGILARYTTSPEYVISALAVLVVGTLAIQFILTTVGGQWRALDEQQSDNESLTRRLAVLDAEHAAVKHASDFMVHGLSAGRFTHDVASPLSTLKLSVGQLKQLHADDTVSLEHEIIDTLGAAIAQLDDHSVSLAKAIRSRPETRSENIISLIDDAAAAARVSLRTDSDAASLKINISLEPSMVQISAQHHHAIGDLIANAARASAEFGIKRETEWRVQIEGRAKTNAMYEIQIRDFGAEADDQQLAHKRIERSLSFETDRRHDESTGLGIALILARLTIVRHGGSLSVHIPEGRGIEMRVRLPGVEAQPKADAV